MNRDFSKGTHFRSSIWQQVQRAREKQRRQEMEPESRNRKKKKCAAYMTAKSRARVCWIMLILKI